ncbi:DUF1697 domain-containing protein [Flavobacteriaceae bacterium S356]|uniref:DUF1697 domain-containing protein n=1 Tax=Asprobacillus argus TaxID=3076534 RepID=A0ABU3LGE1_9FLAO|nr:DUF1697 domain-containing protein [Flavobacteriaceae bacterium S356]
MTRYIVLLRGINVSGKNKLPMQDLRELLSELGYENVQTYIQSGNIILDSEKEKLVLEKEIKVGIKSKFGYDVPVIARTVKSIEKAIQGNPYPVDNEKVVAVIFLSKVATKTDVEINRAEEDQFTILEDVVYIYCPNGFGRSKLTINVFEKKLNVSATSRNWRTTKKLLELAQ